jgi:hypothetical protein
LNGASGAANDLARLGEISNSQNQKKKIKKKCSFLFFYFSPTGSGMMKILEEEPPPAGLHLALVDPFVLATGRVKRAVLQRPQPQREPRAGLLEPRLGRAVKDVAVVPHKDEIALW